MLLNFFDAIHMVLNDMVLNDFDNNKVMHMNKTIKCSLKESVAKKNVRLFLQAIKNLTETEKQNVLCNLVKKNDYCFVKKLGQYGIDFSFMDNYCLLLAIEKRNLKMINVLCRYCGCDPNTQNGAPLHKAASNGWLNGVKCLLDLGASQNIDRGRSYLEACIRNNTNIAEILLAKKPQYPQAHYDIGAHYAILNNNKRLLLKNIEAGAVCTLPIANCPLHTTHYLLLITYYQLSIVHCPLYIVHYFSFLTPYSLLLTHYSLLIAHYLSLPTPHSSLLTYSLLITHYPLLIARPPPTTYYSLLAANPYCHFMVHSNITYPYIP